MRMDPFGKNRRIAALARPYFWAAPAIGFLSLVTGLLEGVGVSLLIPFLSTLTLNPGTPRRGMLAMVEHLGAGYTRDQRLLFLTAIIFVLMLVKCVLQIVANTLAHWVDGKILQAILDALSGRLQRAPYAYFLAQEPGRLVNVLTNESWKSSDAIRAVLTRIAATATSLMFVALLFAVSWKMALIVLVGGLLARKVQQQVEIRIRRLSDELVPMSQNFTDRILFAVMGARVLRLFHTQAAEHAEFQKNSDKLRRAILKVQGFSGALSPALEVMHATLFLIVLLAAFAIGLPLPVLIAFLALMNRLQPHLRTMEQTGTAFAAASGQLSEVEWLLEANTGSEPASGSVDLPPLREGITFDDVTFCFAERRQPAFQHLSFSLRKGRSTALVGGSGAGKSTVVNLLCRLLEPTAGSIKADGVPLEEVRLENWLNRIGIAGQDVELVEGTIAENVRYGRPETSREEIEAALRAAHAMFVFDLPSGLETSVGPKGLSLSGGQRQRIGLARALARKPELLILDEATNATDEETENAILETLATVKHTTTVLVISHKPSTLAFCDDAVLLEGGGVKRTGSLSYVLSAPNVETPPETDLWENASLKPVS